MADFDKINIDAVSYNVKDTTARQQIDTIEGAVNKEVTDRKSADTALDNKITSLENRIEQNTTSIENLQEVIVKSVRDYGAKGDGVTDDTVAFNAAISEVNAGDIGYIYIPDGKYIVGSLSAITQGCHIYGENVENTILLPKSGSTVFTLGDKSTGGFSSGIVERFSVIVSTGNVDVFYMRFGNFNKIRDIHIEDAHTFVWAGEKNASEVNSTLLTISGITGWVKDTFVQIPGGLNGVYVMECQINSEFDYPAGAVSINNETAEFDTLVISDSIFQRFDQGVVIANKGTASNVFLSNVIFDEVNNCAVAILPQGTGPFWRFEATGCWFSMRMNDRTNPNPAIYAVKGNASSCAGIMLTGCRVPVCNTEVFNAQNANGITVSGCSFPSFKTNCFAFTNCINVTITGNSFCHDGTNSPVAGSPAAVRTEGGGNYIICGNNMVNTTGVVYGTKPNPYRVVGNLGTDDV